MLLPSIMGRTPGQSPGGHFYASPRECIVHPPLISYPLRERQKHYLPAPKDYLSPIFFLELIYYSFIGIYPRRKKNWAHRWFSVLPDRWFSVLPSRGVRHVACSICRRRGRGGLWPWSRAPLRDGRQGAGAWAQGMPPHKAATPTLAHSLPAVHSLHNHTGPS